MQISIKPICDWPIYLTASADERLACITQTSFHSTVLSYSLACFFIVLLFIRAPFYVLLVFWYVFCLLVVLVKSSLLAK